MPHGPANGQWLRFAMPMAGLCHACSKGRDKVTIHLQVHYGLGIPQHVLFAPPNNLLRDWGLCMCDHLSLEFDML